MSHTLTVKDAIARLSVEDRAELIEHTKDAIYYLGCCWDALREVENLLDGPEVETDHIEGMAGETDCDPASAYKFADALIIEMLEGIEQ